MPTHTHTQRKIKIQRKQQNVLPEVISSTEDQNYRGGTFTVINPEVWRRSAQELHGVDVAFHLEFMRTWWMMMLSNGERSIVSNNCYHGKHESLWGPILLFPPIPTCYRYFKVTYIKIARVESGALQKVFVLVFRCKKGDYPFHLCKTGHLHGR